MTVTRIQPDLHQIALPGVNVFLMESESEGLVLIDTGLPGSTRKIRDAIRSLGRDISEIRHILITHCHADHTGNLAELKELTGARVYMHGSDAKLVAKGRAARRLRPGAGLLNAILFRVVIGPKPDTVEPAQADVLIGDGDEIPVLGGIRVIHTPGHSEGHVVFLSLKYGALFVGDAAANLLGLRTMMAYEHLQQGLMSLARLSQLDFEIAGFGHGTPIRRGAAARFRKRWARRPR